MELKGAFSKSKIRLPAFLLLIFQKSSESREAIALEFCKKGNFPIRYFKATLNGAASDVIDFQF